MLRHVAAFVSATANLLAGVCRLSSWAEEVVNQQRRPQPEETQRSAAQPAEEGLRSAERVWQPGQVSQPVSDISLPQHLQSLSKAPTLSRCGPMACNSNPVNARRPQSPSQVSAWCAQPVSSGCLNVSLLMQGAEGDARHACQSWQRICQGGAGVPSSEQW